jgi:hypothetical protein
MNVGLAVRFYFFFDYPAEHAKNRTAFSFRDYFHFYRTIVKKKKRKQHTSNHFDMHKFFLFANYSNTIKAERGILFSQRRKINMSTTVDEPPYDRLESCLWHLEHSSLQSLTREEKRGMFKNLGTWPYKRRIEDHAWKLLLAAIKNDDPKVLPWLHQFIGGNPHNDILVIEDRCVREMEKVYNYCFDKGKYEVANFLCKYYLPFTSHEQDKVLAKAIGIEWMDFFHRALKYGFDAGKKTFEALVSGKHNSDIIKVYRQKSGNPYTLGEIWVAVAGGGMLNIIKQLSAIEPLGADILHHAKELLQHGSESNDEMYDWLVDMIEKEEKKIGIYKHRQKKIVIPPEQC